MSSRALTKWGSDREPLLDEIEAAHSATVGTGRGRHYATQQVNQAYVMLLSSHFQGFCRDLHSESVSHLVAAVQPVHLQQALQAEFALHRRLDRGNPQKGNIGADFNRLGLSFWAAVQAVDGRNASRINRLEELNIWRNAIAHQDFTDVRLSGANTIQLSAVRSWRRACRGLANSFDRVMRDHIQWVTSTLPWS